jgi:hypothetical protein
MKVISVNKYLHEQIAGTADSRQQEKKLKIKIINK